jgi:hypothetical protein
MSAADSAKLEGLSFIVSAALRDPEPALARLKTGTGTIDRMLLQICVAPSALRRSSWADRSSEQATALTGAIRRFVGTHWFRDLGSAVTDSRSTGEGKVARVIRLTEANDAFAIEEVTQCQGEPWTVTSVPVAR